MSGAARYDAVVAGFGPSGAVATALLARAGMRVLALDRAIEVYDKPRAIAIDHEILRLLDNLGVADRVLPHVAPFPASEHFGAEGQLIRRIDMVPEPYPLGYVPTMVFTQPPVEAAIRAHAAAMPGVEVALGTELISFSQGADGVSLRLRGEDGAERTAEASWLIGCDGASSTVRKALGIGLDDLVFDEPWLVIDLRVHPEALARLPAKAAQYCDPARPATYIVGPGNHRRWEIMLLPGEDRAEMERPENVWRLLARWLVQGEAELWRAASYRFHALVAHEWRRGRVFLAGDSAHQQPPFIGQGMCQGLRDVANLAWKLAAVRDGAPEALLDSYGTERGAHVRELTARIKHIGETICERDPTAARARDARLLAEGGGQAPTVTRQEIVPPLSTGFLSADVHPARGTLFPQPWLRHGGGRARMDAAVGGGWRLVLREGAPAPDEVSPGIRVLRLGAELPELDGVLAGWFHRHGCDAALVRPDHYVFGAASGANGLARLLAERQAGLAAKQGVPA